MFFNRIAFIEWAVKRNSLTLNRLHRDSQFYYYIHTIVREGYFEILQMVYNAFPFELTKFLKAALEYGQVGVLKWMIQKIKDAQEPVSDEEMIGYFNENQNYFPQFSMTEIGIGNIVRTGQLFMLKCAVFQNFLGTWSFKNISMKL